jgi:hypothetical protein
VTIQSPNVGRVDDEDRVFKALVDLKATLEDNGTSPH